MDKLKALQYFRRVAERQSFSEAARDLGVPASSVSRRLQDLESALGVELLQRTTRRVQLTEVGRSYYERISPLLLQLENADELVSESLGAPSGVLRISCMPSFGEMKLAPIMEDFQSRFPRLTIDVLLSDELTVFSQDAIDIAIRGGTVPNERILAKRICPNKFVLAASPTFLQRQKLGRYMKTADTLPVDHTRLSVAQIEQLPALQYRGPSQVIPWFARETDGWRELALKPALISNNAQLLTDAALHNRGIVCGPGWALAPYFANGTLVEVRTEVPVNVEQDRDSAIYLLYPRSRYQLPKVHLCVEFLLERLGAGIE